MVPVDVPQGREGITEGQPVTDLGRVQVVADKLEELVGHPVPTWQAMYIVNALDDLERGDLRQSGAVVENTVPEHATMELLPRYGCAVSKTISKKT